MIVLQRYLRNQKEERMIIPGATMIPISMGMLLILTVVFGMWLSSIGTPINSGFFNVHRLIAIGFVIFGFFGFRYLLKNSTDVESIITLFIIIAVVSVVILFVTGGLLSFDKFTNKLTLTIHALTPIVTAFSTIMALYLLIRQR
ncbi:MAG: hypothetical protein ACP5D6_02710 [Kosmotogaceae bacterium]